MLEEQVKLSKILCMRFTIHSYECAKTYVKRLGSRLKHANWCYIHQRYRLINNEGNNWNRKQQGNLLYYYEVFKEVLVINLIYS